MTAHPLCDGLYARKGPGPDLRRSLTPFAKLLPTSLALLDRLHGGLFGMGGFRAAGDIGFLVGVSMAGLLLHLLGSGRSSHTEYVAVICGFAIMHLCTTMVAVPALARRDRVAKSNPHP